MDQQTYETQWINEVHRIGRWTLSAVCITSLFPVAYLYFMYGIFPPMDWIIKDLVLITASFGLIWLIEPLTFYPALGLSGCYLAFISGNIGNNKLPAAVLAQEITGVEQGSKQAEIITTLAICGATTTTLLMVALGAVAGSAILGAFPPAVIDAVKNFVVPSIFGALIVSFAIKFPKIIPVAVGVPLLLRLYATMIPGYWFVLITLVATVAATLIMYKGRIFANAQ